MIDTGNETLSEWLAGANEEAENKMDNLDLPPEERSFFQGYCEFIEDILPNVKALEAENERLRQACLATMKAFDGIYGGDIRAGDIAPIETMTPDRQAACHKALELVGAALEDSPLDGKGK